WAWRQVGLLTSSDPAPSSDPGGAIVAAVERLPEHALVAVLAAVCRSGAAPLHRLLGTDGWVRLASVVARAAGAASGQVRALTAEPGPSAGRDTGRPDLHRRAEGALRESSLAGALLRSGLRPSPQAAAAWA